MRIIIIHIYVLIKYNFDMKNLWFLLFLIIFNIQSSCELAENKNRTIVAGGSLTEIIYFLNEQQRLVAVDITSNYPEIATTLPSIGYVRTLSTEGVLSLDPNLILGEEDMGPPLVVDQIKSTGVDLRVIEEDYSLDSITGKILCVAKILGVREKATKLINSELQNNIDNLIEVKLTGLNKNKKVMIILGMDGTSPMVAGLQTSGNGFIDMIGASNIMNSFEGWKPVSAESILVENPDLIIITNRGLNNFGTIEKLAQHPSLAFTNAAQNLNILAIDGMSLLGFGPRTIEVANTVAEKLKSIN